MKVKTVVVVPKSFYSVTELAQLAGCSRRTMYYRLAERGFCFTGRKIPLSDLQTVLSDLWESIKLGGELDNSLRSHGK